MNIYELQKDINIHKIFQLDYLRQIKRITEQIQEIRNSQESPKIINYDKVLVQGSGVKKDLSDYMIKIQRLENFVKVYQEKFSEEQDYLDSKKPLLDDLEKLLKEYNDINQLIYFEYYIKGYSANKIGLRYNYSRRQIYRIINEIDEKLGLMKDGTKCHN